MQIGLMFYILMLIWLVFGFWSNWGPTPNWPIFGGNLLLFILLLLLGWHEFGPPIRG